MPRNAQIQAASREAHRGSRDCTRERPRSPKAILWSELRDKRMLGYDFRRGFPLNRHSVDFYCRVLRLAIEVEAIIHGNLRALRACERRSARLAGLGISVLRFSDDEVVHNLDGVVGSIRRWIRSQPVKWGGMASPTRSAAIFDARRRQS